MHRMLFKVFLTGLCADPHKKLTHNHEYMLLERMFSVQPSIASHCKIDGLTFTKDFIT